MADYSFNRVATELPTTAERPAAGLAPTVSNPSHPPAARPHLRGRKRLLLIGGGLALALVIAGGLTVRRSSNTVAVVASRGADADGQAAVHTASVRRGDFLRNVILSKIQAEENVEALDEAKARLKQLRETFDLKRKAEQADLRVLEIQRDRALNAMSHAQSN